MKNISLLLIGLSLLMCGTTAFSQNSSDIPKEVPTVQSGAKIINVSSSPELYKLAVNWVKEFNQSNPSSKISLDQNLNPKSLTINNLTLVSDESRVLINNQSCWKMVIGRDVIVPIVNSGNPMLNILNQQGISQDEFSMLFNDPSKRNWSALVNGGLNTPVVLWLPENEDVMAGIREFAQTDTNSLNGRKVSNSSLVIDAVKKDRLAIGFCKLSDLRNELASGAMTDVVLLPIDKNGNGRLDNFEKIYDNLDEFTHGVWIGKYPAALSDNIYAVSTVKPTNENELLFLSWILNDGQKSLNVNGFCDLTSSERRYNSAVLMNNFAGEMSQVNTTSSPQSWLIVITIILIVGLFVALFYYSRRAGASVLKQQEIQIAPLLFENVIHAPKGLYFDKTHTWAFMEQDGNVRVGIDDFLQHITGKVTKIKMKEAGEKVRKGEKIMTLIHEGKQLNLYAPVSGTILENNEMLLADSSMINSSPFFKGWVYQIEPTNWLREIQFMFIGEKYTEWLKDEFIRLKDFVTASARTDKMVYEHVVLQDGGELIDNVLADFGPEVWEDFQTNFIDTSR
jgi:glycine cleavage system H lipoate-binding protein/ABC-type phosphate transport system substrate-binding protein